MPDEKKNNNPEAESLFSKYLWNSVYKEDGEVEVYGKILPTNTGELRQISIISKAMIDCDKAFLNSQEKFPAQLKRIDYHPYACEFFVTTWKNDDEKNNKLLGKWILIKLIFGNAVKNCNCKGILLFSASPIKRITCGIEFLEKLIELQDTDIEKYIRDNVNIGRNDDEKDSLIDIKNIEEVFGSIYNVGQGNCSYLNFNNKTTILFDIGETMIPKAVLKEPEIIRKNMQEIRTLKTDYIVLSHWDMDHILGIQHFFDIKEESSFFKTTTWIAPNIRLLDDKNGICRASIYAQRVCVYLLKMGHLKLMNQPSNLCMSDLETCLYQGACTQNPGSKANNIGLILQVEVHKKRFLFAGDCSYWKMRNLINNREYDFIVSSHHGAASAVKRGKNCFAPQAHEGAKAIISSGSNTHRHPHIEHLAVLQKAGFEILFTAGYQKIDFSFSKDGELNVNPIPYRSNESL